MNMLFTLFRQALIALFLVMLLGPQAGAQTAAVPGLQPVPALTGQVIDQTGTLSPADTSRCRRSCVRWRRPAGRKWWC